MGHEISQFEIPDRQLFAASAQAGVWTDIGEAKITRSIFGGARVRVIREQDKKRRAWLLATIAVAVLAAAAWQGWVASQQPEPIAPPPLPLSARIRVSAPTFQPEDNPSLPAAPSARSQPRTPSQIVLDNMATRRESPPPRSLKASGKIAAQPVTLPPAVANKPHPAAPGTNNNSSGNQADTQQIPRMSAPIQPEATTVAVPAAEHPAANKPAAPATPVEPSLKADSTSLPAANNQPSGNAQP